MKNKWFKEDVYTRRFDKSGHVFKTSEGTVDIFAYSEGYHNGPVCEICGYAECWHCVPNPPKCKGRKK